MSVESDPERSGPDLRDLLNLNIIKADPVLRLLAAQRGWEDGEVPLMDAWEVFKVFMWLPCSVEDGGGTFQVSRSDPDPDVLEVFFGRQLEEEGEAGWTEARVVGFHYLLHPPEESSTVVSTQEDQFWDADFSDVEEFWSSDFPSLEEFFSAVESSEVFRVAASRDVMMVTFYSQEEGADEESDA